MIDSRRMKLKKILAFYPFYDEQGDHTEIIYKDLKRVQVDICVKTILKEILEANAVCMATSRKFSFEITKSKHNIPLYVGLHTVMVPFKVRIPICKNDCSYGYFNLKEYVNTHIADNITYIDFNKNFSLPQLQSEKQVNKNVCYAKVIREEWGNYY